MIYEFHKPDNRDREEQTVGDMLMGFILGLIVCLLITMCSSCTTTKYVPVVEHKTDTLVVNKLQIDSIYRYDSISVRDKGDTVWVERWHTRWENHLARDTVYISRTDSVPVVVNVEKHVAQPLAWWKQWLMWIGVTSLAFLLWKVKRVW